MKTKAKTNLPATMQIPGGQKWSRKESGVPGYSSACGNYDVLIGDGYVVLVSMIHDPLPGDNCDFWRKRFSTVGEAITYSESI